MSSCLYFTLQFSLHDSLWYFVSPSVTDFQTATCCTKIKKRSSESRVRVTQRRNIRPQSRRSAACLHILNYSSILLKFSLNLKFTWPIRIQGCSSCFGLISLKDWIHFSSAFSWWFAPLADSYTDTARLKIQRCVIALALYTNYLENAASPSAV